MYIPVNPVELCKMLVYSYISIYVILCVDAYSSVLSLPIKYHIVKEAFTHEAVELEG